MGSDVADEDRPRPPEVRAEGKTMSILDTDSLPERLALLGLRCDAVPTDRIGSAVAALACFPMYMVANVHAWTSEKQFHIPVLDLPGPAEFLESIELGRQEGALPLKLEPAHHDLLGTLLKGAKASDRVIYEYALETMALYLARAEPAVADWARKAIARGVVRVAAAAGTSFFSAARVSPEERACIQHIEVTLGLSSCPEAAEALRELG